MDLRIYLIGRVNASIQSTEPHKPDVVSHVSNPSSCS